VLPIRFRGFAWVCWVVLSACARSDAVDPTEPPASPPFVVRQVLPSATDPGIDVANDPHVAVNPMPTVVARGKLVVFLPDTSRARGWMRYPVSGCILCRISIGTRP
jgi:hypothetical protein